MVHWSTGSTGRLLFFLGAEDELGVAFDQITGHTHLLEFSAVEILKVVDKAPAAINAIEKELRYLFSEDDQHKIVEFLSSTLLHLRDLGLVVDTTT